MKLYTEEQIRQAYNKGIDSGFWGNSSQEQENVIVNSLTPIELPTDEEIEEFAHTKYMEVQDSRWFEPLKVGAKYVINKIQGGNNEQTN